MTARRVPDGQPRELGTTDRVGPDRASTPGFADGLVILRLLAGNVEPMVELPIMPGESRPDERPIPFDPKPLTVALEAQIDSLRDEVVDLVALRARLESRMKARLDGEDWNGLDETLKEFAQLTPPRQFAKRLTKLKERRGAPAGGTQEGRLTKTAQAQIADLQAMIDRYLDDETYRAYVDALERSAASSAAKDKAKTQEGGVGRGSRNRRAAGRDCRGRDRGQSAAPAATPRRRSGACGAEACNTDQAKSTVPF